MATGLLALGDSYTIGEGVEAVATWPFRLAQRLAMPRPDVVARTGWSADELLAALDDAPLAPPYALVTVLVGVNDQYRGREVAEHLPHFNVLLSRAVAFADGDPHRVLVVSIPDWGVTPFAADDARGGAAIAARIDAYNAAQRELCALRDIAWVDVTAASRACGADPAMLVGDGLHPSAAQYAAWLETIAPAARRCLDRAG
ncbi:MAG: GDSL-type esterase/lipase family protein [Pseudoxanthomonas sp.]|nr:GDSL-type esterase/lipase family protein [Pseudoxanthomonas sp.]